MTDWIIISLMILGGISLIIIEIIFVPGTTVVGIMGFLLGGYGIYQSYEIFGSDTGHLVFAGTAVLSFVAIFLSFKSGAWKRFAHKGSIDSKVNEALTSRLEIGKEGESISSLKPIGKADFDGNEYEVTSLGNFVEEKKSIRILKIEMNKIYVEPIK